MALSPQRDVHTVGNPLVFDRTPLRDYAPPPQRGDATQAVMRELGFSDAEITQLEARSEEARQKALGRL